MRGGASTSGPGPGPPTPREASPLAAAWRGRAGRGRAGRGWPAHLPPTPPLSKGKNRPKGTEAMCGQETPTPRRRRGRTGREGPSLSPRRTPRAGLPAPQVPPVSRPDTQRARDGGHNPPGAIGQGRDHRPLRGSPSLSTGSPPGASSCPHAIPMALHPPSPTRELRHRGPPELQLVSGGLGVSPGARGRGWA